MEKGFSGCSLYWPVEPGPKGQLVAGSIRVTLLECAPVIRGKLTRRVLRIEGSEGTAHCCEHFHHEAWPNYGCPSNDDMEATRILLRACLKICGDGRVSGHRGGRDPTGCSGSPPLPLPPLVVHCSGGVGRSGAFLTSLAALLSSNVAKDMLTTPPPVSAELLGSIVTQMRAQRHPWCVESYEQFLFAARVVALELAERKGDLGVEAKQPMS